MRSEKEIEKKMKAHKLWLCCWNEAEGEVNKAYNEGWYDALKWVLEEEK